MDRQRTPSAEKGPGRSQRRLRVLAVDDDPALRRFYAALLNEEGHEVALAANGAEALAHLDWLPDLILLDLMMPVMDGYEFLRRLRQTPRGRDVPVLVLSAAIAPGRRTVPGAQAYLRKPFDFGTLVRTLEALGPPRPAH
ncbi:MAG: response regulator [Candidatus Limnocylindria bacterium]